MTTKEVKSNRAAFSFTARELSLPISFFNISVNRVIGESQRLCQDHRDARKIGREYQENLFPNGYPPVLGPRDDSKVFEQEIFNLEEYSFYTVSFIAMYEAFMTRVEMATSVTIDTPPAGKICTHSRVWASRKILAAIATIGSYGGGGRLLELDKFCSMSSLGE